MNLEFLHLWVNHYFIELATSYFIYDSGLHLDTTAIIATIKIAITVTAEVMLNKSIYPVLAAELKPIKVQRLVFKIILFIQLDTV